MKIPKTEVLNQLSPEWPESILNEIHNTVEQIGKKIVVLVDDPTVTQTVYGIPILTLWQVKDLVSVFRESSALVYLLTNSRSLTLNLVKGLSREIAKNLPEARRQTRCNFDIISRSDATLRGHYPGEVDARPLAAFLKLVERGKVITPDIIFPKLVLSYIGTWFRRDNQLTSDIIQSFSPAFGILWVGAIMGCTLLAGQDSIWAIFFHNSYDARTPYCLDPEDPWLQILIGLAQTMVGFAGNRYPIAIPPIHSPLDIFASIRGDQRMFLELIETLSVVKMMLGDLTQLYLNIIDILLEIIPSFYCGYSTRLRMWAPDKAIAPQNKYSSLVSIEMYEKFALLIDRIIPSHYSYHSFHFHGTAQHQVDLLVSLECLSAIQITLKHHEGGSSLDYILTVGQKILQKKLFYWLSLILRAPNVAFKNYLGPVCVF